MNDKFLNYLGVSCSNICWRKAYNNLFRVQFKLYKSVLSADYSLAYSFQSLLWTSTSVYLIAIREVTQIDSLRRIPGLDGKVYLDFSERFELLQFLKKNFSSWVPAKLKKVVITRKDGSFFCLNINSLSDRCWQNVVKYSLLPAHEAFFSHTCFGFRLYKNIFDLQKLVLLNINETNFPSQKRILIFDLSSCYKQFNYGYLLNKIFISRSLKLIIFRFLQFGFRAEFVNISDSLNLNSILANILFDGIHLLNYCFRFGSNLIFFLKPIDNEKFILKKLDLFLYEAGFNFNYESYLLNAKTGFYFLDWYFYANLPFDSFCIPSFDNYQSFLRRVKRIINNSNYGAKIKSLKLFPVVRDWCYYNRFTNLEYLKSLLYFIKKRTFRIFNSESKQDRYSSKVLINKCFSFNFDDLALIRSENFFTTKHVSFWLDDFFFSTQFNFCCVHCGIRMTLGSLKL
jgi:retron-type reverse transcriptase